MNQWIKSKYSQIRDTHYLFLVDFTDQDVKVLVDEFEANGYHVTVTVSRYNSYKKNKFVLPHIIYRNYLIRQGVPSINLRSSESDSKNHIEYRLKRRDFIFWQKI